MPLDKDAVDFLAREQGINPAFIEKDWHAVRVLSALSTFSNDDDIVAVFTGGTSLSKAHGILKRFSEDLDFRVRMEPSLLVSNNKKDRSFSAFRDNIIETLKAVEDIAFTDESIEKSGLGFKVQLAYPQTFDVPHGMRPELQVDFSKTPPRIATERHDISSFVAQYKGATPEANFQCVSPVEIAADKFSSLAWRIVKRDRNTKDDDPSMIRHLHDLHALEQVISQNRDLIKKTTFASFDEDQGRPGRNVGMSFTEAAKKAHATLESDTQYRVEYQTFVNSMSYADEAEAITFDDALSHFHALIKLFQ